MLSFSGREKPGLSASSPGAVKPSGMVCVRIVADPALVVAVHVEAAHEAYTCGKTPTAQLNERVNCT